MRAGVRILSPRPARGSCELEGVDLWTKSCDMSIMSKVLTVDPDFDKQAVFQLLSKFDLSAGDVAEVFSSYLKLRAPTVDDLDSFRNVLKKRGTEAQIEILEAAGPLLTSEEIRKKLGVASRQTIHNYKKDGALLSISFANRKGDYFPAFQVDGHEIRAWVPQLLRRIGVGWDALSFLVARRRDLAGASYLEAVLADPRKVPMMLAAADVYVS
ncbi:hypothetical protein DB345_05635 [Spartobacteria bacterium LR76]|nr:hypothetical protein DB345_05635 [Spartobacteria bacterium LR76]